MAADKNPDAKLIVLGEAWEKQNQVWSDVANEASNADFYSSRAYPEPPATIMTKVSGKMRRMNRVLIEQNAAIPVGCPVKRKEYLASTLADYDQWDAQCRVVDDQYRVHELEKMEVDEYSALCDIDKEILATPANTVAGLLVKLRIWGDFQEPNFEIEGCDRFVESALKDAKRLSGQIGGHHG